MAKLSSSASEDETSDAMEFEVHGSEHGEVVGEALGRHGRAPNMALLTSFEEGVT
jgi:hypothetical protein